MTSLDTSGACVSVAVPSDPKYLRIVRRVLESYMEQVPIEPDEAGRLVLAIDEACSNVIKYAYESDASKTIEVTISSEDDVLRFSVRDYGRKPDLSTIAPRPLEEVRPGGLGTHFIRSVMDTVSYNLDNEQGTQLIMTRNLRESAPNTEAN